MYNRLLAVALLLFTTTAIADPTITIHADNANGANTYLGKTLYRFPEPVGEFSVISSGAYNPHGVIAFDLDESMPDDTLIASKVDDKLGSGPWQFDENLPLRMVPTYVDADFTRGELDSITEVAQDQLGQSLPNKPITIGDWAKAKGTARIKCGEEKGNKIVMRFKGLIPNGIFTVWQTMGTEDGGLTAVPLGGVPNVFVASDKGRAKFVRELNACPLEQEPGTKPVLLYEVAYHSDGLVYGGLPDNANMGLPFGLQTHTILNFPILIDETL